MRVEQQDMLSNVGWSLTGAERPRNQPVGLASRFCNLLDVSIWTDYWVDEGSPAWLGCCED